ncbi:YutD family protein [Enterococcus mediterraneensis]|uniref:YutD family protein n=1 Tax=Enterococcus mediterraneensis TaxID=2364791 RepID=UPI000F06D181|nr:YutD family protein [Enterococcus mediterraneensis]
MSKEKQPEKAKNITDELTNVLEEIIEEPAKPKKEEVAVAISDTDFMIGSRQYKLVKNHREGFDLEKLGERYSDVLARYDYIVGDWGYEQLRLKGFFEADNRKAFPDQRIDMLEDYLYEYCNFGCAYFVIQRVGGKREKGHSRQRRKKNTASSEKQQAHVAEKREVVASRKSKPVIKNRRNEKTKNEKNDQPSKTTKKEGFVIRKRED